MRLTGPDHGIWRRWVNIPKSLRRGRRFGYRSGGLVLIRALVTDPYRV
jgi:hypothetical protein